MPDLEAKRLELCRLLSDTCLLLSSVGEGHWNQFMAESRRRIEQRDYSGVTRLLGCFGGMGSFNDLVLAVENDHRIAGGKGFEINEQLETLRSSIYRVACEVRREYE